MALVDYSDSETSDVEAKPIAKVAPHPSKGAFQKVVDRSNPGKIRVTLPQVRSKDDPDSSESPAKRIKTGGGGFSDFNSFLPPPKRTNKSSTETLGPGKGLIAGVSLKTGSEPGFVREPEQNIDTGENSEGHQACDRLGNGTEGLNLIAPLSSEAIEKSSKEVPLAGKSLTFKPLSVARKPARKGKQTDRQLSARSTLSKTVKTGETPPLPKTSLFSISAEVNDSVESDYNEKYRPLVYGALDEDDDAPDEPEILDAPPDKQTQYDAITQETAASTAQSLECIASDLSLSEADKRRLFGRQKGPRNAAMPTATNIINFNTDDEYKHNEELRAAGDRAAQNPVRSIAPGKHSLRQLLNAVSSQKDALEESFARGKSNRAEAGSRYGW